MMQNIRVLVVFLAVFVGLTIVFKVQAQEQFPGLAEAESSLVEAIRIQDEMALLELLLRPQDYFDEHSLEPNSADYLWHGDNFRDQYRGEKIIRSILELIEMGPIVTMRGELDDSSIIVSFIPQQFSSEAVTMEFFTNEWMVKFFSCHFVKTQMGWKMVNLCFDSSGGPYPEPYG